MWVTEFGPVIKTTDPEVFKSIFKTLSASGGGDNAEQSLSALQVLPFFLVLDV